MMQRATVDIKYRLRGDTPGTPIREDTIESVEGETGSEIAHRAENQVRYLCAGKKVFVVSTNVRNVELVG